MFMMPGKFTATSETRGNGALALFRQEESGAQINAHGIRKVGVRGDNTAKATCIGAADDIAARNRWRLRVFTFDRWHAR